MSAEAYRILQTIIFLPLYLTAFVGVGLVLRVRRTDPRACWYAVTAASALFLNWGSTAAMHLWGDETLAWTSSLGLSQDVPWFVFNCVLSALQTTSAAFLIAAIVTGRQH